MDTGIALARNPAATTKRSIFAGGFFSEPYQNSTNTVVQIASACAAILI
ncbi:MAG: hypothetical protein WAX69_04025 [Victivallales bacterium]